MIAFYLKTYGGKILCLHFFLFLFWKHMLVFVIVSFVVMYVGF